MGKNIKRKILYISGTRADYGLMRQTLLFLKKQPNLEVEIAVTGMHLMKEFGQTAGEVRKDGFKIYPIEAIYEKDDKESMVKFVGEFILKLSEKIKKIKPDIIFVQGDRAEMLAGAIVGVYSGIPVVHSHGGDVTTTVDEFARHAITKLSHIHLAATQKSAARIIKMGEDSWRVFAVGAPGLDGILSEKLLSQKELAEKYDLDFAKPVLLVLQHPVLEEAAEQMRETMEAIKVLGYQTIVVYPNADAGGRRMIKIIRQYGKLAFVKIFKNLPRKDYLGLMKFARALVGNSSSGIIEASSFGLPAVNIGDRQEGRERACNVIDAGYSKEQIKRAIRKAIDDKKFRENARKCKNPYGDGRASLRIAEILSKIKINRKLLQKQITY